MVKAMGEDRAVELLDENLAQEKKRLRSSSRSQRVSARRAQKGFAPDRTCVVGASGLLRVFRRADAVGRAHS